MITADNKITHDKPQIITHSTKTLSYTPSDVKWIPNTAKFVVMGQNARGTGAFQINQLSNGQINSVKDVL